MSSSQLSQSTKPSDRKRLNIREVARAGRFYSLAVDRFPGMPLFPGHPPFQVLTYRSPQGIRVSGAQPWGSGNDVGLGYMCEYVRSTSHSGAHIDALAHMTIGDDDHWFCGAARTHLGDFGPTAGDATAIPTIWTRGVLFEVPRHRGVDSLGRSEPVPADELKAIARGNNIELGQGDVAHVRTGYYDFLEKLWSGRRDSNPRPQPSPAAASPGALRDAILHMSVNERSKKTFEKPF
jgi:Putative cyclase